MNYYDMRAKDIERASLKQVQDFFTLNGHQNTVVSVTPNAIMVKTKKSKQPYRLSRQMVRKAIAYILYRRTVTRRDLEKFTKWYNSALMGLLKSLLFSIVKASKTASGLLKLTLRGVRYFFSGAARSKSDMEVIAANNGCLLLSYWHLREDKYERWRYHVNRLGLQGKILIDSGEYSRYRAILEGKPAPEITLQEYAEFICRHKSIIYGFINLDVVGDPEQSKKNEDELRKLVGMDPIPVWHVQSSWDELQNLIDSERDYPCIAIGGSVFVSKAEQKRIFDELFVRFSFEFHLLGGSGENLLNYPWHSSDGSSWIARRYGYLVTATGQIRVPEEWTMEEALHYNVQLLAKLEEMYHGVPQTEIPVQPKVTRPRQLQMSF